MRQGCVPPDTCGRVCVPEQRFYPFIGFKIVSWPFLSIYRLQKSYLCRMGKIHILMKFDSKTLVIAATTTIGRHCSFFDKFVHFYKYIFCKSTWDWYLLGVNFSELQSSGNKILGTETTCDFLSGCFKTSYFGKLAQFTTPSFSEIRMFQVMHGIVPHKGRNPYSPVYSLDFLVLRSSPRRRTGSGPCAQNQNRKLWKRVPFIVSYVMKDLFLL